MAFHLGNPVITVLLALFLTSRVLPTPALEAERVEPYRAFVEQMRTLMRREEQGRFGDLPPLV